MGQRYDAVASYLAGGPAKVTIPLGRDVQAGFVVGAITPPSPVPSTAPFSLFRLEGPNGSLITLSEAEITQVQPGGPPVGQELYITLDSGITIVMSRLSPSPAEDFTSRMFQTLLESPI